MPKTTANGSSVNDNGINEISEVDSNSDVQKGAPVDQVESNEAAAQLLMVEDTNNNDRHTDLEVSSLFNVSIKVEGENRRLRNVVAALGRRIGDEVIVDTESSSDSDITYESEVNTRHYQRDGSFGKNYYYITNVSC